jgi:hypothetical protein
MSCRAIHLDLHPADHGGRLQIQTYTYAADAVQHDSMAEELHLDFDVDCVRVMSRLTPDEARVLANQLLQVADVCDEARRLRESFDEIQEDLREAGADDSGGFTGCLYAHPWVHYVAPGRIEAKVSELNAAGVRRYIVLPEPAYDVPVEPQAEASATQDTAREAA